ncbi:SET domain-containing protein [Coprinopsis marcescibilis]|uniref:SET domain-containing protein n=1 Tax=Coprinopsis marcescibilis TaxID=230819 RepID=A0A5C3L2W8_COPMA|nr:SET domain-containing protein [Coprinopsis marcescibilis]
MGKRKATEAPLDSAQSTSSAIPRWKRSESPVESFSDAEGADANECWEVDIVGEEVDYWGNVRLEAEWTTWKRKDGTNATWKDEYLQCVDTGPWKSHQKHRRKQLAAKDRTIQVHTGLDIHNNETRLRAMAFEEKLKASRPCTWGSDRLKIIQQREEDSREERLTETEDSVRKLRNTKARLRERTGSSSFISSSSPAVSRMGSAVSSSSRMSSESLGHMTTFAKGFPVLSQEIALAHPLERPMSEKAKGKQRELTVAPPVTPSKTSDRRRSSLGRKWTNDSGVPGAPITFVNDEDDEEVPPLPPNFTYLERGYKFSDPDVLWPSEDFFLSCRCKTSCNAANNCDCQDPSELRDSSGRRYFAYDEKGRFKANKVPRGVEVIECTSRCSCNLSCRNRVAQRPRDIPIEIFKTPKCGWGVRSSTFIEKGKVLGIYTGELIPRKRAHEASKSGESSYCFDLDGHEDLSVTGKPCTNGYSVDSYRCGNWTRFINHSCSSNIQIYLVVYDTVPDSGMPYAAYVAKQDIPANEELVFDYNPHPAPVAKLTSSSKRKGIVPRDRDPCYCDATECRGYL